MSIKPKRTHHQYLPCRHGRAQAQAGRRLASDIDDVTCGACLRLIEIRDLAARTRGVVAADMDPHDVDRAPAY
ncbi:MAG: hypothetical protein ACYC3X_31250 [Pirellulaceae bacterium]